MGPIQMMVFFILGLVQFSLSCPGCIMPRKDNYQVILKNLTDTLKNVKIVPKGLQEDEQITVVRIVGSDYQVKQIVAGVKYYYEFEAKGVKTNNLYDCKLEIVRQDWRHKEEIDKYNCDLVSPNSNERSLGAEQPIDVHSKNLQELKSFFGHSLTKQLGSKYLMRVINVQKATKQIVAGVAIRATLEVGETDCLASETYEVNKCSVQPKNTQICQVEVWLKPWMNFRKLVKAECKPQTNTASDVTICAGCPMESNPNDPTVQKFLKSTIGKLNEQPHSTKRLTLEHITKVTTQVVSGIKYTIDFDAKDETSGELYSCNAVLISRPWISPDLAVSKFKCTPRKQQ